MSTSRRRLAVAAGVIGAGALAALTWLRPHAESSATAVAAVGPVRLVLREAGRLHPARALTYRSPLGGRDAEITWLAPEGATVKAGDVVARVDPSGVQEELVRLEDALRQRQTEVQLAEADLDDARAQQQALADGERIVQVEEVASALKLEERRNAQMKTELEDLRPLLAKGYITREELQRQELAVEESDSRLALARRRYAVLNQQTRPREERRAASAVGQRDAALARARQGVASVDLQLGEARRLLEACVVRAQHAGLIVHEDLSGAVPRRRVRPGDRVTGSQGLVTIPEVAQMHARIYVREVDIEHLRIGHAASIAVDAFPRLRLRGRVAAIGALATQPPGRATDEPHFEVGVELIETDPRIRPEMATRVEIVTVDRPRALLVPIQAVVTRDGKDYVQLVRGSGTALQPVTLGIVGPFEAEVTAGLSAGDRVALAGGGR
jgi:HlyD family secretion protein